MKAPTPALLALLALAIAPTAGAQDGSAYYGVSFGELDYSEGGDVIDDTVSSWRLMINYQFMEHLSVEGGLGQSGDIRDTFAVPTFPTGTDCQRTCDRHHSGHAGCTTLSAGVGRR